MPVEYVHWISRKAIVRCHFCYYPMRYQKEKFQLCCDGVYRQVCIRCEKTRYYHSVKYLYLDDRQRLMLKLLKILRKRLKYLRYLRYRHFKRSLQDRRNDA